MSYIRSKLDPKTLKKKISLSVQLVYLTGVNWRGKRSSEELDFKDFSKIAVELCRWLDCRQFEENYWHQVINN